MAAANGERKAPPRRVAELEHAVAHHDQVVTRSRWLGLLGIVISAVVLTGIVLTGVRLYADYGGGMFLPREQFVPAVTCTIVGVALAGVLGLGAAALRHFEGETPRSVAERAWADPIAAVGSLAEPASVASVLLYVPFVFAYFATLVGMRRVKATRADILAAAELLHRSRDPAELARLSARGGASLAGGWKLIDAMGLERIHASRRTGPGLGARAGSAGVSVEPGAGIGFASGPIEGLLPRWESRDWAEGEHFHLAFRSGRVLVQAREVLTLFDADGERMWAKTFPAGQHVLDAALAPDGGRIAVLTARPELWLLTADTGHALSTRRMPDAATSVALTDGGEQVFVGDKLGSVRFYDRQLQSVDMVHLSHPAEHLSVACETDRAVAASLRGVASVFRTDGSAIRKVTLRSDIRRVWMEEDGERAMLLTGADGLMAYDLHRGHVATYGLSRPVIDGDSDAPGDLILLLTVDGRMVMLDSAARILWQGEAPQGTVGVRLDQDGGSVWTWASNGALQRLSLNRGGAKTAPSSESAAPLPRRPVAAPLDLEPEREAPVQTAHMVPQPIPRGFRNLAVDPETGLALLTHPSGVVVLLDGAFAERARHRFPEGTGPVLFADRGGLCVVASDESVVLVDSRSSEAPAPHSGMLRAPSLARVADGTGVAVGTGNGEIGLATASGGLQLLREGGPRVAGLVARELAEGPLIVAALGDGTVTALDRNGEEHFRIDGSSEGTARLAFGSVGVLVAESDGRLTVYDPSGAELASRRLALPVISAERLGPHFLVTDKLGNLHRFEPDLVSAGTRPPPQGLTCLGVDSEGEPWLAHVHRHLLTLETWRGELRGRWKAPGTPLDLEPTARGSWLLLTPGGLLGPEIAAPPAAPKKSAAGYLEI